MSCSVAADSVYLTVTDYRGVLCPWGLLTMCWRCFWFELNTDRKPYVWALQRGWPAQPHTYARIYTHSEAETDTQSFFTAQWEAATKRTVQNMRSCMSVTTLRIPQTLFTCDANVSTSCLWWHCTYHKRVAARIRPKKTPTTSEMHVNSSTCQNTQSFLVCGWRESKWRRRGRGREDNSKETMFW